LGGVDVKSFFVFFLECSPPPPPRLVCFFLLLLLLFLMRCRLTLSEGLFVCVGVCMRMVYGALIHTVASETANAQGGSYTVGRGPHTFTGMYCCEGGGIAP
jgi:hypothetical protein